MQNTSRLEQKSDAEEIMRYDQKETYTSVKGGFYLTKLRNILSLLFYVFYDRGISE